MKWKKLLALGLGLCLSVGVMAGCGNDSAGKTGGEKVLTIAAVQHVVNDRHHIPVADILYDNIHDGIAQRHQGAAAAEFAADIGQTAYPRYY